jgi:hypothetical protein
MMNDAKVKLYQIQLFKGAKVVVVVVVVVVVIEVDVVVVGVVGVDSFNLFQIICRFFLKQPHILLINNIL